VVDFRFHDLSADVTFSSGATPDGWTSQTVDLRDGWSVQLSGPPFDGSIFGDRSARALAISGLCGSVLLGLFVYVLGTSRGRAMELVERQTAELRHQALHDPLTDLPNRALVMDRIEHLMARNRRACTDPAVLFVDLDGFKNVNDTLGHDAGDRLLVAVAARLTSVLRDADTVGRMGGDEFVVLLDGVEPGDSPELVADRVLDVMRQPFDLEGAPMPVFVRTSVGIAAGDRPTGSDLLRDADLALYEAKASGKDRSVIFRPDMQTTIGRRMELEFHLRSAIDDGGFELEYVPVLDGGTGGRIGMEAVLRWAPPGIGPVELDELVPLLDQTGRLREVGRWVLHEACSAAAAWRQGGDPAALVVALAGRQLDQDTIADDLVDALAGSGLEPEALIVEVSERTLERNLLTVAHRLRTIHGLGVRVAVQVAGLEHSALDVVHELPIDWHVVDHRLVSSTSR
jgi:diguanylate cyclase (GGDEF)-like protein